MPSTSPAYIVAAMPAKELDDEQLADARRLKAAWQAWKVSQGARKLPSTQEHVAAELGFKTQSAVSQYLNGDIPLNADALKKFCRLFGVKLDTISPSIVAAQRALAQDWLVTDRATWTHKPTSVKAKAKKPAKEQR